MNLLDKYKSVVANLLSVLAGLIVAIDPKHIDKFAEAHPQWSGLIIAAWAAVIWWANKTKQPQEPPGPQPMPPESQKQQYGSARRP